MTEQPNREVAVLNAALELRPAERAAYLDQACAGDAALRQRVEELLEAHEQAGDFLDTLPAGFNFKRAVKVNNPLTEKPGDKIGRYKLLQQIGEGGCGVVYMAEQEEPVRRRVALKVIKLGMDTNQVIARFEAERQALALMDHPNIAKVLDAGATETGRPYFVMELVRGIKITEFCDENRLSTQERLKLFIQVCQAVQHAHQKGVIHRDIKPSNILVTVNDGVPVPKVIDFGIAKATQGRLTDHTLFTAFEQFIGTPAYMSPEQAVMTSLDIDTRSDIYSLGVLLYELLTGRTPFDQKELLAAGLDEMRRTISEKEPPKPSTRLTQELVAADVRRLRSKSEDLEPESEEEIRASSRQLLRLKELIHLLRGDLDWIAMKCLEKDRSRRYETANGLAADIQRHLDNEPVNARPPSSFYRLQKAIHRNKGAFAATAVIVIVLLIGVVVSTSQAIRATRAERDQVQLRQRAEADEKKARTEAAKSQQVADFLKKMLEGVSPSVALGRDTVMLREIAGKTARSISTDLEDQPEVEIELRFTLAKLYFDLELWKEAEEMTREILRVASEHFGEENLATADALSGLGRALVPLGEFDKAEAFVRRAIAMQRKLRGEDSLQEGFALCILADLLYQGRHREAESAIRAGLAIYRKRLGNDSSEVALALTTLNMVLEYEGKLAEAEAAIREALAIRKRINPAGDQATSAAYGRLGRTIIMTGSANRLPEAESYLRIALELDEKIVGKGKFSQVYPHLFFAEVLQKQGKLDEAEIHYREGIALFRQLAQDAPKRTDYIYLGHGQWRLADVLAKTGRRNEAEQTRSEARQVYEQAAEQFRKNAEGGDVGSVDGLAWLLATCPDSKVRDGQRALSLAKQAVAATNSKNGVYLDTLAAAYAETGQFAEAVRIQKEAMILLRTDQEKPANAYASRLKLYESSRPFREVD